MIKLIYLDSAASSYYKPEAVARAAHYAIKYMGANPGRSSHDISKKASEKIFECRENAAKLFNAQCENIIFTQNATHALNMAIKGALKSYDHALCSDMEHNSVYRPLYAMQQKYNVQIDTFCVDFQDDNKTLLDIKSKKSTDNRVV